MNRKHALFISLLLGAGLAAGVAALAQTGSSAGSAPDTTPPLARVDRPATVERTVQTLGPARPFEEAKDDDGAGADDD